MKRACKLVVIAIPLIAIAMAVNTTIKIERDDTARSLLNLSVMMKNNVDNPDLGGVVLEQAQYVYDLSRITRNHLLRSIGTQWCSTAIIVLLCIYIFRSACRNGDVVPRVSANSVERMVIYADTLAKCKDMMAALEEASIGSWIAEADPITSKQHDGDYYVVLVDVKQREKAQRVITAKCDPMRREVSTIGAKGTTCPACRGAVSANDAECPDCGLNVT